MSMSMNKVYIVEGKGESPKYFNNAEQAIRYAKILAENHKDDKIAKCTVRVEPLLTWVCT